MKIQTIPLEEITFGSPSLVDTTGRIFWWQGSVYRAIAHKYTEFHRSLLEEKNVGDLFSKGLVRTEIAPLSVEGYGLVLQHERIPFTSYCMEWSSEMLKDAALLYCDLSLELCARGLGFKDAQPWNVLFDKGRPVFVDWGSIVPFKKDADWIYREFRGWFILPLYLMSAGRSQLARTMMLNPGEQPSAQDVFRLLINRVSAATWLRSWLENKKHLKSRFAADSRFFESLRRTIEVIPVSGNSTEWTDYSRSDAEPSLQSRSEWSPKTQNVYALLHRLQPKTLVDVGCNKGWFAELAALQGAQVIAMDIDEPSMNMLYHRIRTTKMQILPFLMDICIPTPAHGYAFSQASIRLKSDMVLALALTHHLVFKKGFTFEAIAERLTALTGKWLVVEFIPADDQHVSKWMDEQHNWYCLDGFVKALHAYFGRVEVLESSPSPRVLLFCERLENALE